MDDKNNNKKRGFRAFALTTSLYGGISILGPLLILGGGGYVLDRIFHSGRLFFICGIASAFIVTNVLLYKRAAKITQEISRLSTPPKVDDPDVSEETIK